MVNCEQTVKMTVGTLKYIAIMESFKIDLPLYDNAIFIKYFTDFYGLDKMGSFRAAPMRDVFYRIFQAIREFYDKQLSIGPLSLNQNTSMYKDVCTALSCLTDNTEGSFSSKVLHTLYPNLPLIDMRVRKKFNLNASYKNITGAKDMYEKICEQYFSKNKIITALNGLGLVDVALSDKWDKKFSFVCICCLNCIINGKVINGKKQSTLKSVCEVLKDICRAILLRRTKLRQDVLKVELYVEEFFIKTPEKQLLSELNRQLGIDIFRLIDDISLVKKIDFYLWAVSKNKLALTG